MFLGRTLTNYSLKDMNVFCLALEALSQTPILASSRNVNSSVLDNPLGIPI